MATLTKVTTSRWRRSSCVQALRMVCVIRSTFTTVAMATVELGRDHGMALSCHDALGARPNGAHVHRGPPVVTGSVLGAEVARYEHRGGRIAIVAASYMPHRAIAAAFVW